MVQKNQQKGEVAQKTYESVLSRTAEISEVHFSCSVQSHTGPACECIETANVQAQCVTLDDFCFLKVFPVSAPKIRM